MNWPDYDRGLVRRGDIRFWIDERALEPWEAVPPIYLICRRNLGILHHHRIA